MEFRKNLLVCLLFFLFTLIFFHNFLTGDWGLAHRDLGAYFYPMRCIMVEQVKAGILPLWNPYLFCGNPFLAVLQTCFFYPFSIIFYLPDFLLAFNYYTILHYFLASIFTYHLMRYYGAGRWGGIFSGIIFAYSGYLLSAANVNTTLSSVIWFPLAILYYDKLINSAGRQLTANGLKLILVLACMFLGGEPTIIYVTCLVLFAYGIWKGEGKIKNCLKLGAVILLVFLLCAVQTLPFIELLGHSDRGGGDDFPVISYRSFPPRESINFILPFFFGNLTKIGSYSKAFLGETSQDLLVSEYFGLLPLFFAVFSIFNSNRIVRFWTVIGLSALVLAFGKYTPLFYLCYKFIPGFSFIRYPAKYFFLFAFSIALLGGWGADNFKTNKKIPIFLWILSFLLFFFYNSAKIYQVPLYDFFLTGGHLKFKIEELRIILDNFDYNIKNLIYLSGISFVFGSAVFLFNFKKIKKEFFLAICLIIIGFDLFSANGGINIPIHKSVFDKVTSNVSLLQSDHTQFRYYLTQDLREHNWKSRGDNYNQMLQDMKDKLGANRVLPFHLSDFNGYDAIVLKDQVELMKKLETMEQDQKLKLLGALNVKYIGSLQPLQSNNLKLIRYNKDYFWGQIYIYLNQEWKARAYLISNLESLEPALGQAKILKYSPQEVIIKTNSDKKAYLFLSDSHYPGWVCFVDGKASPIYKAASKFRGVELEKGEHLIKFSYQPFSFRLGAVISFITLIVILTKSILPGRYIQQK